MAPHPLKLLYAVTWHMLAGGTEMSSSSYGRVAGGRLKIGGREVEVKKKKKKRRRTEDGEDSLMKPAHVKQGAEDGVSDEEGVGDEPELEAKVGQGRIISSGTIVTGLETRFMEQLRVNDAIIITHPSTFKEEIRIVKMIVSNTGMSISSAFSTDLISSTSFRYIHPPSDEAVEDPEERAKKAKVAEEQQAFGTYAGTGSKLVYRVKKGGAYGGYKIIAEDVNDGLSRTELLELRSKHKSDRHAC